MATPATWKSVVAHYKKMPDDVQSYFNAVPGLAQDYPWEVSLSYQFGRVELAHNMTLYCGVVKLHQVDSSLARRAVEAHHITRERFTDLFETIFEKKFRTSITKKLDEASNGIDKLTRRRGLALPDGDCSALYVDANAHSERVLRPKDA